MNEWFRGNEFVCITCLSDLFFLITRKMIKRKLKKIDSETSHSVTITSCFIIKKLFYNLIFISLSGTLIHYNTGYSKEWINSV